MVKLIKPHHSLKDWNLQSGHTWNLTPSTFVSPPCSLRSGGKGSPSQYNTAYLKQPISGNLKHARFFTWKRCDAGAYDRIDFHFRAQDFYPGIEPANGYRSTLMPGNVTLYEYRDGNATRGFSSPNFPTSPLNTWVHFRWTWWSYLNEFFKPVMAFVFEREESGKWVQRWQMILDYPLFEESEVNRIGFTLHGKSTPPNLYLDDTEIWKPAE